MEEVEQAARIADVVHAGGRKEGPMDREEEEEHEAEPEDGHAREEQRDGDRHAVEGPAEPRRGEGPEDEAREDHDEEAPSHQDQRVPDLAHQHLRDRDVHDVRVPEVPLKEVPEPDEVLDDHRAVESELLAERRGALLAREHAEDLLGDVARREVEREEDDEGDAEEDRNRVEEAPGDEVQHGVRPAYARIRSAAGGGGSLPRAGPGG